MERGYDGVTGSGWEDDEKAHPARKRAGCASMDGVAVLLAGGSELGEEDGQIRSVDRAIGVQVRAATGDAGVAES